MGFLNIIFSFLFFFFVEQNHFLSLAEEGLYWICIRIISLIYNIMVRWSNTF